MRRRQRVAARRQKHGLIVILLDGLVVRRAGADH